MNKLHENSTPEEIHAHIDASFPKEGEKLSGWEARSTVDDLVSHPAFNKEHFDKTFSLLTTPEGKVNENAPISNLLESPYFSKDHANVLLNNLDLDDKYDDALYSTIFQKHPDLDKTKLYSRIDKDINNKNLPTRDFPYFTNIEHDAGKLNEFMAKRPQYKRGENLSPEDEEQNKIAHKIDTFYFRNIADAKHTSESLSNLVDYALSDKIKDHTTNQFSEPGEHDEDFQHDFLSKIVSKRQDLSKDHLNKIFEKAIKSKKSNYSHHRSDAIDVIKEVVQHKNTDPTLLAKVAKMSEKDLPGTHWDIRRVFEEALQNPNLPHETINSIINEAAVNSDLSEKVDYLLGNPALTKDQVSKIHELGNKNAINHPNADTSLHAKMWENSDKSTEVARHLLGSKSTPPEVLKELVNHKNKNVALEALDHPNADMTVINEGLSRKMKDVQDKARKHPLVADTELKRGFAEGKIKYSTLFSQKSPEAQHFQKLSPEEKTQAYEKFSENLKGTDIGEIQKKSKESEDHIFRLKTELATNPEIPEHIRKAHTEDIINAFSNKIPANSSDYSFYGDDHRKHYHSAFNALLANGNKDAEKTALNMPGFLHNFSFREEEKKKLSPEFINSAFDKIKNSAGQTLIDERGIPSQIEGNDVLRSLKNIASSPKLSEEKFEEYLSHPAWADTSFLDRAGARFKNHTLLDERYEGLSDEERHQAFARHMTPERFPVVATSRTAPKQLRGEAFDKMDSDERTVVLHENRLDMSELPDENIKNAILGSYNSLDRRISETEKGQNFGLTRPQFEALKALDGTKPSHVAILESFLDKVRDDGYKISEDKIKDRLDQDFFTKNLDFFERKAGEFPKLHAKASVETAMEKKSPEESLAILNKQAEVAEQLNQNIPESGRELFWEKVLSENNKDFLKKLVGKSPYGRDTPANGNLDFLKDIVKENRFIKGFLVSNKLITPEAENEIKNSFKNYKEFLSSLSVSEKFNEISGKLKQLDESGVIDPSHLPDLIEELNPAHLIGNPYSRSITETEAKRAKSRIISIYDAASSSKQKDLSELVLKNAFDTTSGRASFTKKFRAEMSESLLDHVMNKNYSTPEQKAEAVERFYSDWVGTNEENKKLLGKIGDFASSIGNTQLLVDIFKHNSEVPKSISTQISKMASKPDKLSVDEMLGLASLYDDSRFGINGMKGMHSGFEKTLTKKLNSGEITPAQAATIKKSYIGKVSEVNINSEKSDLSLSILRKYMSDPDTADIASAGAYKYLSSDSLSRDQVKSLYLSLPEDNPYLSTRYKSLPREVANDPEIIENSTSGWKLNSLIHSLDTLSPENISTLTARAMSEEAQDSLNKFALDQGFEDSKAFYFSKIMNAPQSKEEDVNKFLRSMSQENISKYISSPETNNFAETHAHVLISHLTENISKTLHNPELANLKRGQPEHIDALLQQAGLISAVLNKSDLGSDDLLNTKEKISSFREGKAAILHSMDAVMANIDEKSPHSYKIGQVLADTVNSTFSLDDKLTAKTFDTLSKFERHIPAVKSQGMSSEFFAFGAYQSTIAKAESLTSETTAELASKHPVYPFAIAGSNISKEMIDPLDFDKLFQEHKHRMMSFSSMYFGKMEREALEAHGSKIMNSLVDFVKKDARMDGTEFRAALISGLEHAEKFFDYESLSKFTSKVPVQYKDMVQKTCIESGVGGQKYLKERFEENTKDMSESEIVYHLAHSNTDYLRSPSISTEISNKVIDSIKDFKSEESEVVLTRISENKYSSEESVSKIASILFKNHEDGYKNFSQSKTTRIALELIKHPNMKYEDVKKIFDMEQDASKTIFRGGTRFHPAFTNPRHGSKILRSLPVNVPEPLQAKVSPQKAVRDISVSGKQAEKLTQVMQSIPAEGIAWPEFKRKFPKFENIKEVKELFLSKKNQPVVPEDLVETIKQADEATKNNAFHVTFSDWDGAQRHNRSQTNLVVQLNSSQKIDDEMAQDPKLWALYQMILKENNGISNERVGTHPTTPHLISWSRVDVSNKDSWIIEEFQSDAAQKFRKNLRAMIKNSPSGLKLNGQDITPSDLKGYMTKIDSMFENWQKASMEAVIQNAKAHGIKNVFMHGHGIRSMMSGGQVLNGSYIDYNKDFVNPRIKEIYDGNAEKFGFEKVDYTDYPNFSKETLKATTDKGLPTHCWKLKVP